MQPAIYAAISHHKPVYFTWHTVGLWELITIRLLFNVLMTDVVSQLTESLDLLMPGKTHTMNCC